jgi:carboxypeptidase family protein
VHLVVSLVIALSMGQLSAPAGTGGISGRVVAEGSNAAVAGARVFVFPAGRRTGPIGPPPQTITDEAGRFVFAKLEPGEYRIEIQKTGFAPMNDPMSPARTMTVVAGPPIVAEFRLQRGGVVSGRILDSKGEPMTDAAIRAMRRASRPQNPAAGPRLIPAPMQGLPAQTNDLGEFRLSGLAPGEYVIAAVPHAFSVMGGPGVTPRPSDGGTHSATVTTFYPGTTDQMAAQFVTVSAGAEVANIVFAMQSAPAFRVSGIVVDENGAPVGDATVMLMADPHSGGAMLGPAGNGRSDANGRFAIDDVPSGTYRANASIMMRFNSGGARGAAAGVGVSGGVVSFSSVQVGPVDPPVEIVVTDADVKGIRVVARRPVQR